MDDTLKQTQAEILTTSTQNNEYMEYSTSKFTNTGLNPNYFSGFDSIIVNALNTTYAKINTIEKNSNNFTDKYNNILLDCESIDGKYTWDSLKNKMGKKTLIEGLLNLYENIIPMSIDENNNPTLNIATADELIEIYNSISSSNKGGS